MWGIRCVPANETFILALPPVYFDVGVVETKTINRNPVEILGPIGGWLTKSRFSKYAYSLESLMQPLSRRS
jgi:hypothetical protein